MKTYTEMQIKEKSSWELFKARFKGCEQTRKALKFNKKIARFNRDLEQIDREITRLEQEHLNEKLHLQEMRQQTLLKLRFYQSSFTIHKIGD